MGPLVVDPSLGRDLGAPEPRQDASRIRLSTSLSNWPGPRASAYRWTVSAAEFAALTPGERYEVARSTTSVPASGCRSGAGSLSAHSLRRRSRMGNTGATRRPSAEFRARGRRPAFTRAIRLVNWSAPTWLTSGSVRSSSSRRCRPQEISCAQSVQRCRRTSGSQPVNARDGRALSRTPSGSLSRGLSGRTWAPNPFVTDAIS